ELTRSEQDAHTGVTEFFDAPQEYLIRRQSLVDERQHDDAGSKAGELGELVEDVVVGDTGSPLVDRVVSGRGHDDGVGPRQWLVVRLAVVGTDLVAAQLGQRGQVQEVLHGGRRGNA